MTYKFIEIFNIPDLFELIVNYYIDENINNIMHFMRIIAPVNTLFSNNIEFLNLWGSLIYSKLNYSLNLRLDSHLFKQNTSCTIYNYNYTIGFIRKFIKIVLNNNLNYQPKLFENLFKNLFNCDGYGFIFSLELNKYFDISNSSYSMQTINKKQSILVFGYIPNKIIEFPRNTKGYCIFIKLISYSIEDNKSIKIIIPNKYKATNTNSNLYSIWQILINKDFFNKIINHPNVFKIKI